MDFLPLKNIAIEAARLAGVIIQNYKNKDILVERKDNGTSYASQVVTEVDRACEAVIMEHLLSKGKAWDLAILSEETEDDGGRFEKEYFWCIDPIDGTLPFINKQPGFSVSIALIAKDGTPCIGVVLDPSTENLYHASLGQGAFKNDQPWKINADNNYLTYVTDRKLKDTPNADVIQKILNENVSKSGLRGIKEIDGAGSVLNAIYVLENGPACMLKLPKKENGGGSIWDFAATACIFHELQLPATDFQGHRLNLNKRKETYMNKSGIFYGNGVVVN